MGFHQIQRREVSRSSAAAKLVAGATGIACVACCAIALGFAPVVATAIGVITWSAAPLGWAWLWLLIPAAGAWVWLTLRRRNECKVRSNLLVMKPGKTTPGD